MADLAALLAEVKAALHDGSGIPISNPEARWLGALVQAVEDQQRQRDKLRWAISEFFDIVGDGPDDSDVAMAFGQLRDALEETK